MTVGMYTASIVRLPLYSLLTFSVNLSLSASRSDANASLRVASVKSQPVELRFWSQPRITAPRAVPT